MAEPQLAAFPLRHGVTPAQAALGWLLARDDVIAIPKSGSRARLKENHRALDYAMTKAQREQLERLFPPPRAARALEML